MSNLLAVTPDTFEAEVLNSTVPVVADFWAEWCGPCRMLAPVLEEIATEKGDAAKIVKVDVQEHQDLAAKYGVANLPTLLLFKDGEVKDTLVGLQGKDAIVEKIDALA